MNPSVLLIRADASPAIGTGHVMRCLAIAQHWRRITDGQVVFACAKISATLRRRLVDEGCTVKSIGAPIGEFADSTLTRNLAAKLEARALILDGYAFDGEYQAAVAGPNLTRLVIDDYGHAEAYDADFVLNQNAGASQSLYVKRTPGTRLLLGLRFALLRTELTKRRRTPGNGRIRNILVTLGGSDPKNITALAMDALAQLEDPYLRFRVIVGSSNERKNELLEAGSADSRFTVRYDVFDMSREYHWADFAVAAGGSTNWEMCYFGIPRLLIVLAENQLPIARHLEKLGCCRNLGWSGSCTAEMIAKECRSLLDDTLTIDRMRHATRALVDGNGATRVVSAILRSQERRDTD